MALNNLSAWSAVINRMATAEMQAVSDSVEARRATGLSVLWDIFRVVPKPGAPKAIWDSDIADGTLKYHDRSTGVVGADSVGEKLRAELGWAGVNESFSLAPDIADLDPKYLTDGQRDVVTDEVARCMRNILVGIEDALFLAGADTPVQTIRGLAAGIQAATTYAGINAGTTAKWASYIDSASGDLTGTKMTAFLEAMSARNARPTVAVTGHHRFNNFVNEVQAGQTVNVQPQVQIGGVAMTGFRYSNTLVVPVAQAPDDKLYAFDPNDIEIQWSGVRMKELPQESLNSRICLYADIQLVIKRPYYCGAMTALTDAS